MLCVSVLGQFVLAVTHPLLLLLSPSPSRCSCLLSAGGSGQSRLEVECDELHGQHTCVKDVMARCPDAKWDPWVNLYLDIIEDMMNEGECGVDLTLSGMPPGSPPTPTSSTPTSEALFNSTDDPVVSIRFMASPLPTPSTECPHSELQPNISTQSDS